MRVLILAACLIFGGGALLEAAKPIARHPYRRQWKKKTFGKRALARVAAGAGIQQARGSPRQWGGGGSGFGKRIASGFGKNVVKNTIQYGVAGVRHESLGYQRSRRKGFGHRLRHALVSTVVTRKTNTGKRTVAAGRISGAMGSGMVSRAWQPAAMRGAASGAASGGIALGADAAANVAREFWPRGKKHGRQPARKRRAR